MEEKHQPWISVAVILGFASMVGAIAALAQTDKGKQLTKDAAKQANKAKDVAVSNASFATEYMDMANGKKAHDSYDLAQSFYETWGLLKGRGRVIEHVEVHLEDGTSYRLRADHLNDAIKRELIGRAHRL
jgi:hypothetical protein